MASLADPSHSHTGSRTLALQIAARVVAARLPVGCGGVRVLRVADRVCLHVRPDSKQMRNHAFLEDSRPCSMESFRKNDKK